MSIKRTFPLLLIATLMVISTTIPARAQSTDGVDEYEGEAPVGAVDETTGALSLDDGETIPVLDDETAGDDGVVTVAHERAAAQPPVRVQAPVYSYGPAMPMAVHPGSAPLYMASVARQAAAGCDRCDGGGCNSCDSACDSCGGGCDSTGACGACGAKSFPFGGLNLRRLNMYVNMEYLAWYAKGRDMPALVTTSVPGTPVNTGAPNFTAVAGALPAAGILFGNQPIGRGEVNNGARLTIGMWADEHETLGVATRLWAVDGAENGYFGSSNGDPILAIPFFDTDRNEENTLVVAHPSHPNFAGRRIQGEIDISSRIDVYGAEVYGRMMVHRGCGIRLDAIGGYQFTRLDDTLVINSTGRVAGAGLLPAFSQTINDIFEARNEFHGGKIGLLGEVYQGPWRFSGLGTISFGSMRRTVLIRGNTTVQTGTAPAVTTPTGLFAQPSNINDFSDSEYALIPEAQLTVGYRIRPNIEVSAGYSFIYWSRMMLAGDQVDRVVNLPPQVGGPNRPAFLGFNDTDYWLMGANFGLQIDF